MPGRKPAAKPTMQVAAVPVGHLVLDEKNARKGDVAALMSSLKEFGQHRAVVAQKGTRRVIAGNHLVMAAQALGWSHVDVVWVDDDDETAIRRGLADNLVGDRATWDEVQLKSLLADIDQPLAVPGMDEKMLDRLLAEAVEDVGPGKFEISARPGESYNYAVVVSMNEMDGAWLAETLGLRQLKSYKSDRVGLSRVITVPDLKKVLNAAIARGEPII